MIYVKIKSGGFVEIPNSRKDVDGNFLSSKFYIEVNNEKNCYDTY